MAKEKKEVQVPQVSQPQPEPRPQQPQVEFELISSKEISYGNNDKNFIEVAVKRVKDSDQEPFISISKGFKAGKMKKYKAGLGMNFKVADEVADTMKELIKGK